MIGIYKITSPTGKVYIGQSVNINKRFKYYESMNCKGQTALYASFLKHGIENHVFETLEECLESELNNKERYYQDVFDCIGKDGLNCRLTKTSDRSGKLSEETKLKISISNTGKKQSKEHREKWLIANKGKKPSEETKIKMSLAQIGKKKTKQHCENMSKGGRGKIISIEQRIKLRDFNLGKTYEERRGFNNKNSINVLCLNTGIFYGSIKQASVAYNINYSTLKKQLSGECKNKTNLIYV